MPQVEDLKGQALISYEDLFTHMSDSWCWLEAANVAAAVA